MCIRDRDLAFAFALRGEDLPGGLGDGNDERRLLSGRDAGVVGEAGLNRSDGRFGEGDASAELDLNRTAAAEREKRRGGENDGYGAETWRRE